MSISASILVNKIICCCWWWCWWCWKSLCFYCLFVTHACMCKFTALIDWYTGINVLKIITQAVFMPKIGRNEKKSLTHTQTNKQVYKYHGSCRSLSKAHIICCQNDSDWLAAGAKLPQNRVQRVSHERKSYWGLDVWTRSKNIEIKGKKLNERTAKNIHR